jgi:hypothetical protein
VINFQLMKVEIGFLRTNLCLLEKKSSEISVFINSVFRVNFRFKHYLSLFICGI